MPVSYARIQEYLNKVGSGAALAPHGKFWRVTHDQFVSGIIPGVKCAGSDIPIVNASSPASSAFYEILSNESGFCGFDQMPAFGRKVTEPGFTLTLSDGTVVSGSQVLADIHEWLEAGAPDDLASPPAA